MRRRLILQAAVLLSAALPLLAQPGSSPRFVAPPGDETRDAAAGIDRAVQALTSGHATPSSVLSDPQYLPFHKWPRFRAAIRDHATREPLTIVTPAEPGPRLVLKGTVLDHGGKPTAGALVYVYQTSAKGWYSDEAAHVAAPAGDEHHARLFGYVLCDPQGRFEVRTIRPAGYPESTLPAHIHVEIGPGNDDSRKAITEVQFADDPRLTPEVRRLSLQAGFVITKVKRAASGQEAVVELRTAQ